MRPLLAGLLITTSLSAGPLVPEDGSVVLLITSPELAAAWKPFADWKTSRGKQTRIITTELIDARFEGPDLQEKIRRCVRKAVDDLGAKWVILGGDSQPGGKGIVPDRDTVHQTMWGASKDIPTDTYYLSPTNWDADGDGIYGEHKDAKLANEDAYPVITTVSCFTGQFDAEKDPCIVGSMLRQPKAGAIAIVAPCREGKPHFLNPRRDFPLMTREGKLDGTTKTMTLFWTNGITNKLSTGHALMATKASMAEDAKQSAEFHLCLAELNLLGDPTLDVHPVGN